MKKTMILMLAALLFGAAAVEAQETEAVEKSKVGISIGTDVVSRYIWRGQDLGQVSLQPTLGIEYKGLSLSAWGSEGLSEPSDTKEFDLTLAYSIAGFNIGVTDYWFNAGLDPKNRYFKYNANSTNHVFEANVGYDFKYVSVQWYTNFAGNDGLNSDGKRAYSSYFEIAAPFRLVTVDWLASVGAVPYDTDFYGVDGFAVTNVSLKATKDIHFTDKFTLPIFAQITANPRTEMAYFLFGFTLQPWD
jgi:hypothetical protein